MKGSPRIRAAVLPEQVVVIGGGRWSRETTGVLASVVPESVAITVCSRHNQASVLKWTETQGLRDRITVSSQWPPSVSGRSVAVIVVNAARDHETAAEWSLAAGYPTLVEKPVALTSGGAMRLADLANRSRTLLAAAHVFRFASYLEKFARMGGRDFESVRIEWVDPANEDRYGESKRYDGSIPVYTDCLPHIVSILASLGFVPTRAGIVQLSAGGADLALELSSPTVSCRVRLRRNGDVRRRLIESVRGSESCALEFSAEPGTIGCSSLRAPVSGDDAWRSSRRPLRRLLTAFLLAAGGGDADPRLDFSLGITACRLSDQIAGEYRPALARWLAATVRSGESAEADVRYALSELLQADGRLPDEELERRIAVIRNRLTGAERSRWTRELTETHDPAGLLTRLAA